MVLVEVLDCLNYLNDSMNSEADDGYIMSSKQLEINFFHDARQSFGCTALILQGGSLFGLCHRALQRQPLHHQSRATVSCAIDQQGPQKPPLLRPDEDGRHPAAPEHVCAQGQQPPARLRHQLFQAL